MIFFMMERNHRKISMRQAVAAVFTVIALPGLLASCRSLKTDSDESHPLIKYDIVSREDFHLQGNISVLEALQTIWRASNSPSSRERHKNYYDPDLLRDWYSIDILAPLDDKFPEEEKSLIMMLSRRRSPVLKYEEILNLDLQSPLTHYEALVYVTRMIGDTFCCVDQPEEVDYTERSQTYDRAFERGLISDRSQADADKSISRQDFYSLLHAAMSIEMSFGGEAGSSTAVLYEIHDKSADYNEKEIISHEGKLTANPQFNDDFSISFNITDGFSFFFDKSDDYSSGFMEVSAYDSDGDKVAGILGSPKKEIETIDLIEFLLKTKNRSSKRADVKYLEVEFSRCNKDWTEEWIKSFRIDLSGIKVLYDLPPLVPGILKTFERQWVPSELSLAQGSFKKGAFYLIHSYQHRYRKAEYNWDDLCIFTVDKDGPIFLNSSHYSFNSGGIYTDDAHIQEVVISGNAKEGFVLHLSPESEGHFTEK